MRVRYNVVDACPERLVRSAHRCDRSNRLGIGQRGLATSDRPITGYTSRWWSVGGGRTVDCRGRRDRAGPGGNARCSALRRPSCSAGPRQRDAAHARCVATSPVDCRQRVDRPSGMQIGTRERPGWIDILAFNPETRVLLVIEVKTDLVEHRWPRRQLGWYHRKAEEWCRDLGWDPSGIMAHGSRPGNGHERRRIRGNAVGLRPISSAPLAGCDVVIGGAQTPRCKVGRWR